MAKKYITGHKLQEILNSWSECVATGIYKEKVPYKTWRELLAVTKWIITIGYGITSDNILYIGDVEINAGSQFANYFMEQVKDTVLCGYDLDSCTLNSGFANAGTAATTAGAAFGNLADALSVTSSGITYSNKTTTTGETYTLPNSIYIQDNGEWHLIGDVSIFTSTICEDNKEKENMNIFKNFEFGSVKGDNVKLSIYGVCVKNKAGTYVAYDAKSGNLMDVDILNFNGQNFLYRMPVALTQVNEGDIVVHNSVPMFVVDVPKDRTSLDVIDPYAGERKEILPAKSPFGFDFVVRVVSLFDQFTGVEKADAENPFGNMLPFLLMGDNKDAKDMLPMMLMMGGNVDPMMAMMLMGDGNKDNLLPLMFMVNNQKHECKCGGTCQH